MRARGGGGDGEDLRRRHHPQPLGARSARNLLRRARSKEFLPFAGAHEISPARACKGCSWPWHALALGWAGLAVQQAHNQRSGTAGRAQGVCMDGGMRACEGGVATEQRASTPLLRRSRSSILRPTLWHGSDPPWVDVCRRREGSWAAMFCVDSWICVVSVARFVVQNTATAPLNSGRRPNSDGMLG